METPRYAARIEDDVVVQVIVGDPEWAEDRLGGVWVGSDVKVGIGWTYVFGEFIPPTPEYVDFEDGEPWES